MKSSNRTYQIACFLSPQLSNQEELDKAVQKIKEMITKKDGLIPKQASLDNPVKKRLAYPIKKHQEAFYLNFNFTLPTKAIDQLDQELNLEENVIRHLINIKKKTFIQPEKRTLLDEKPETVKKFSSSMVDKVEPISPDKPERKEKLKIKELDKKLEEILNQ